MHTEALPAETTLRPAQTETPGTGDNRQWRRVWPALLCFLLLTAVTHADIFPDARKQSIYIRVHDLDTKPLEALPERLTGIEEGIDRVGRFWAENSGGKVSFWFEYIFDAAIELDAGAKRPDDWLEQVRDALWDTYEFDLEEYGGMKAFDIEDTAQDADQTWAGLSIGRSQQIYMQSTRFLVFAHEAGHQLGLGHAAGFVTSEPTFLWDPHALTYVLYDPTLHGYALMPFAIEEDAYGHYDSVMGNHVAGHVSTRMKRSRRWLSPTTHRRLNLESNGRSRLEGPAEPIFRLFAHDQLQSAVMEDELGHPIYGVTESYDRTRLFSLAFDRDIQTYDPNDRSFAYEVQEVSLEYRDNSRYDGLFFSIDDALVDVNEARQVWHLPAVVGHRLDEYALGTSFYIGDGEAFLTSDPPAPLSAERIRPERYLFEIVEVNEVDGDSYVDVSVRLVSADEVPPPDFPRSMRTGRSRTKAGEAGN